MFTLQCPVPECNKKLKLADRMYVHFSSGYEDPGKMLYSCVTHAAHLKGFTKTEERTWRGRDQKWYVSNFTREAWDRSFQRTRSLYRELIKQKNARKKNKYEAVGNPKSTIGHNKRKVKCEPSKKNKRPRRAVQRNVIQRRKREPKTRRYNDSTSEGSVPEGVLISKLNEIIQTLNKIHDCLKKQ